eukprot:12254913-Alexandrium_andersonii.AAC.1
MAPMSRCPSPAFPCSRIVHVTIHVLPLVYLCSNKVSAVPFLHWQVGLSSTEVPLFLSLIHI